MIATAFINQGRFVVCDPDKYQHLSVTISKWLYSRAFSLCHISNKSWYPSYVFICQILSSRCKAWTRFKYRYIKVGLKIQPFLHDHYVFIFESYRLSNPTHYLCFHLGLAYLTPHVHVSLCWLYENVKYFMNILGNFLTILVTAHLCKGYCYIVKSYSTLSHSFYHISYIYIHVYTYRLYIVLYICFFCTYICVGN